MPQAVEQYFCTHSAYILVYHQFQQQFLVTQVTVLSRVAEGSQPVIHCIAAISLALSVVFSSDA